MLQNDIRKRSSSRTSHCESISSMFDHERKSLSYFSDPFDIAVVLDIFSANVPSANVFLPCKMKDKMAESYHCLSFDQWYNRKNTKEGTFYPLSTYSRCHSYFPSPIT
jgi:hypothetical protein